MNESSLITFAENSYFAKQLLTCYQLSEIKNNNNNKSLQFDQTETERRKRMFHSIVSLDMCELCFQRRSLKSIKVSVNNILDSEPALERHVQLTSQIKISRQIGIPDNFCEALLIR